MTFDVGQYGSILDICRVQIRMCVAVVERDNRPFNVPRVYAFLQANGAYSKRTIGMCWACHNHVVGAEYQYFHEWRRYDK